jgi:hypothetical protein
MTSGFPIAVASMRAAAERLFDAVEEQYGPEPEFDDDHYWLIELDDVFNLDRDPRLGVGQLSDDVESIRDFLERPEDEYIAIWHEMSHLIGLLTAVARRDLPP